MFAGKGILGRAILGADCKEAMLTRVSFQFIGESNALRLSNAMLIEGGGGQKGPGSTLSLCHFARSRPELRAEGGATGRVGSRRGGQAGVEATSQESSAGSAMGSSVVWGVGRSSGDAIDGLWG